ncbi:protein DETOXIFICATION 55 [Eucalyptus grandis]|nr:protein DETOXIFICATION 55 [Eucalyptus grandis]
MGEPQRFQSYPTVPEAVEELKRMADIGIPILAVSIVNYLKNMVSVASIGRLGSLELAGGALAIGFTNITGYSVLSGLAMGMEPLCSQAFGSNNLYLVHSTLRRTILMLLLASIPIGFLWVNLESIMLILNQSPDIAQVAGLFCRFALPDLVANSLLHPSRIYLRSKGTTWPLMWCSLLAILVHIPLTIFLAFTLDLGIPGIAISNFATNFNILLFLLLFMLYARTRAIAPNEEEIDMKVLLTLSHPWPVSLGAPNASLKEEWKQLLSLAIPSCLAVCLEWWWYEFMTILAGYLPHPRVALATAAIVIQTTSLLYSLPTALSASVSSRVGNELGAGRAYRARLATITALGLALVASLFGLLWTTLGRRAWGRVFTSDSDVLELTMVVLPLIGLCELANCPQTTSCGVLRGSARPSVGAAINFCAFYLVGAPVALVLAFVYGLGFLGLCYGLLAAQIACVGSMLLVIYRTDWERESMKALDLVGEACDFAQHEAQFVKV